MDSLNPNTKNTQTDASNSLNAYQKNAKNNNEINETEKEKMKLIENISDLLSDICDEYKSDFNSQNNNTLLKPFLLKQIPSISIKDYLIRLNKYTKLNNSTIILILIYIDKICNYNKFKLSYYNIHKLILASMLFAIKYNEDEYYSLKFYAELGGISINEMSNLEYQFLVLIRFELYVDEELFNKYSNNISSSDIEEEEDEDED